LITKVDGPIWDTALWKASSGIMIIAAEDSGRVSMIDPRMAGAEPLILTVKLISVFHHTIIVWLEVISTEG